MPHNPLLTQKRNEMIVTRFRHYKKKNPKWTIIALLQEVADEFYLNPTTVSKIIKGSGLPKIPSAKTVAKYVLESAITVDA